jgi:hypothetical protein
MMKITNEPIARMMLGANHGLEEGFFSSVAIRVAPPIATTARVPLHVATSLRLLMFSSLGSFVPLRGRYKA